MAELLAGGAGVCQDFAHLAVCRAALVGLAARYVSGYLETTPPPGRERLVGADASHAWASVFTGADWLDLDPTNDRIVDASYVEVAHGRDYADVPPLKGVIFSDSTESVMDVAVDMIRVRSGVESRVRSFACPICGHLVFFENSACLHCGTELGYCPVATGRWSRWTGTSAAPTPTMARLQLAASDAPGLLCGCARSPAPGPPTPTRPAMAAFAGAEAAKRRLVYQLDDLGLPTDGVRVRPAVRRPRSRSPPGTPTASSRSTWPRATTRTARRCACSWPSRTARCSGTCGTRPGTGTGRCWSQPDPGRSGRCSATSAPTTPRPCSGTTPPRARPGGSEEYVSTYATAHPWEDWAETFAHYLHIRDTLQTAAAYGMCRGARRRAAPWTRRRGEDPDGFAEIVDTWLPLTYALNAVNRSAWARTTCTRSYLSAAVLEKLGSCGR